MAIATVAKLLHFTLVSIAYSEVIVVIRQFWERKY